jgi:transposase
MRIVVLGIDLGKNLCSLAGLDETGAVILRRRMKRASVLPFTAQLETCTVAMEACCGAHHLGRQLVAQGHVVRLMSPAYVKPYVKAQKNDERDAEAIAEAATRPTMRYVEIKSEAQLEVQSLHRVRGRLVAERTALINQLRALMLERGIAVPQGRCKLARYLPAILSDERNGLGPRLRLIEDMREEWRSIDCRIKGFNDELAERVRNEDTAPFPSVRVGRWNDGGWGKRYLHHAEKRKLIEIGVAGANSPDAVFAQKNGDARRGADAADRFTYKLAGH